MKKLVRGLTPRLLFPEHESISITVIGVRGSLWRVVFHAFDYGLPCLLAMCLMVLFICTWKTMTTSLPEDTGLLLPPQ